MKKTKFFAMLFAAFAMTVSLTACGDDDDEPGHDTEQPTGQVNVLSIDGHNVNFNKGIWTETNIIGYDCVVIDLQTDYSADPEGELTICLYNSVGENGNIPTGTYKHLSKNTLDKPCYYVFGDLWGSNYYELDYESEEGSKDLKVEYKNGVYTLTMSKLVMTLTDENDKEKKETTSFTFKGQLPYESIDYEDYKIARIKKF